MSSVKVLCQSKELPEGATLECKLDDGSSAILLRKEGILRAYRNECPHMSLPLNFLPNKFWDTQERYLQCTNHMAFFKPETGECVAGPCPGTRLRAINIDERDGVIRLSSD